jgi:hypothetical protein
MKIVKNYSDFVSKINESNEPIEAPVESTELEAGLQATEEMEEKDPSNIVDSSDEYEEEEGGQYEGTVLMKQLADALGAEVVNNEIDYEGHKINYFSETESFHVDKKKFDSMEEVLDFLKSDVVEKEAVMESKRNKRRK